MRVAAVQLSSVPDAAQQALAVGRVLRNPALEGADLVVLPEAIQRGFGPDESLSGEAESLDGPFIGLLHEAATRLGAVVVAGMFEESGAPSRPFNTTVAVGPSGVLGAYRKVHLYDALGFAESSGISPGSVGEENRIVIEVAGWKVGLQTCFDLRFPESSRRLALGGAEVLVLGAAWAAGRGKEEQFATLCAARANESTSFLVAAAQPAPRYCGNSMILDPRGMTMVRADAAGETVVLSDLSDEMLAEVRAQLPLLEARRLGIEAP